MLALCILAVCCYTDVNCTQPFTDLALLGSAFLFSCWVGEFVCLQTYNRDGFLYCFSSGLLILSFFCWYRVLTALNSGLVIVWDYKKEKRIKAIEVSKSVAVSCAKFVPEKNLIVCDAELVFIRAYNYLTWSKIQDFAVHDDRITCLTFEPSHQYLISSSDDMTIRIWNYGTDWSLIHTLKGHSGSIRYITCSPIGNILASACEDGMVKIWSVDPISQISSLNAHEKGSEGCTVKVWDYRTKTCFQKLDHNSSVSTVIFYPDPPLIIVGSVDGELKIWNFRSFRLERTINYGLKGVLAVDWGNISKRIAIGYEEGFLVIKLKCEFAIPSMDNVGNIIWEKNCMIQAVNTTTAGFEAADGEILKFPVKDIASCDLYPKMLKHSPNGQLVALYGDGNYAIYGTTGWKLRLSGSAQALVWSSVSEFAITEDTITEHTTIKIFNKLCKERKVFRPLFPVNRIFGGVLLSASSKQFIRFYDWNTCEQIDGFEVDMNVRSVHWADDNVSIAIDSDSRFYILKYKKGIGTTSKEGRAAKPKLELLHTINERVRSGVWAKDSYMYVNSSWCLKFCTCGQITKTQNLNGMQYLPRPMALTGYLTKKNQIYLVDNKLNLVRYQVTGSSPDSVAPMTFFPKVGLSEVRERMKTDADYEFSWKDELLNGQYILPSVRDQGKESTCAFESLSAAADITKMQAAACEIPPRCTDIRFSASSFVADYESMAGPIPLDIEHKRLEEGLKLFESRGVHAEGGGAAPGRYKIASSQFDAPMPFEEVAELILEGKPVVGAIRVARSFGHLKPHEIYDLGWDREGPLNRKEETFKHCVVFVGFGQCASRPYLVFLNSHGTKFGEEGFGRVYFEHAKHLSTLEF